MRLMAALSLALLALGALLVWLTGAHHGALWWIAQKQHALQTALAAHIQALRSGGDDRAFWSLVMLCATYGFLHAAGPGHGKALVVGGALATRATARRMVLIATAGSFAQALVAIALVYGSLTLLAGTARGTLDAGQGWMTQAGNAVVALIGGWLLVRGGLALGRRKSGGHDAHGPAHGQDGACGCGHAHHPEPEAVARAGTLREAAALVFGMAARPCTGALVVLVIAWKTGLAAAGAAGVLAMGLGTSAFTALVGYLAVKGRETAFVAAGSGTAARIAGPLLQILAGGAILLAGTALLLAPAQLP